MQFGVVVGVDGNSYRVVACEYTEKKVNGTLIPGAYDWNFVCKIIGQNQLAAMIQSKKLEYRNVTVKNGKIVGISASLARFNESNHKPLVFLSKIVSDTDALLGYKVAGYNGEVKNISLKEMLAYGKRITTYGNIAVQNAVYVMETDKAKAFFREYPDQPLMKEVLHREKTDNPYAEHRKPNVSENQNNLNKAKTLFNDKQREQLQKASQAGIDVRLIANPKFTPEQMRILRGAMQKGLDVSSFAFPEYSAMKMATYVLDLENDVDISEYTNPKYSLAQLSELSLASELGLDVSKMANIQLSAEDMAEIRERMQAGVWRDWLVKKDGSWK